jgi:hypothetical protein
MAASVSKAARRRQQRCPGQARFESQGSIGMEVLGLAVCPPAHVQGSVDRPPLGLTCSGDLSFLIKLV